jgi:hypothetical protein
MGTASKGPVWGDSLRRLSPSLPAPEAVPGSPGMGHYGQDETAEK